MSNEAALALAAARGFDPAALRRVAHRELEIDATSGGYAFENASGHIVIVGYDGSYGTFALHDASPTAEHVIRQWLTERRHANRRLVLSELGVWQQAAVVAAREGVTVAELELSLDPDDTDYAEFVRIHLSRSGGDPLRTLAAYDHLLEEPGTRRYTHPCPLCGRPALHTDRYPRSVCDSCYVRTADSTGRLVTGSNVSLTGGFVAHFTGTAEICAEVTASKRCWVGEDACSIDEAYLGGVVVQALRP